MSLSSVRFCRKRILKIYGSASMAIKAMDLVCTEMTAEKGHKRFDGSDFYNHPVDVVNDLLNHQIFDETTIVAAFLHDIVEDIPKRYTIAIISTMFGEEVADIVDRLTKKEGANYKDPNVMQEYLDRILERKESTVIKIADRKHNMYTLIDKDFAGRYRKAVECEKYFLQFFKTARKRYEDIAGYCIDAKHQIEAQILEIKDRYQKEEMLKKEIKRLSQLLS